MTKTVGNWEMYFSKIMNMEYGVNKKDGRVCFEDKVVYYPDEIEILKKTGFNPEIHKLKKEFEGRIVG